MFTQHPSFANVLRNKKSQDYFALKINASNPRPNFKRLENIFDWLFLHNNTPKSIHLLCEELRTKKNCTLDEIIKKILKSAHHDLFNHRKQIRTEIIAALDHKNFLSDLILRCGEEEIKSRLLLAYLNMICLIMRSNYPTQTWKQYYMHNRKIYNDLHLSSSSAAKQKPHDVVSADDLAIEILVPKNNLLTKLKKTLQATFAYQREQQSPWQWLLGFPRKNNILDWCEYLLGGFLLNPIKNSAKLCTEFPFQFLKELSALALASSLKKFHAATTSQDKILYGAAIGLSAFAVATSTSLWLISRAILSPLHSAEAAYHRGKQQHLLLGVALGGLSVLASTTAYVSAAIFLAPLAIVYGVAKIPAVGLKSALFLINNLVQLSMLLAPAAKTLGINQLLVAGASIGLTFSAATWVQGIAGKLSSFIAHKIAAPAPQPPAFPPAAEQAPDNSPTAKLPNTHAFVHKNSPVVIASPSTANELSREFVEETIIAEDSEKKMEQQEMSEVVMENSMRKGI